MTTRICGAWLGFPLISSILGDFMWISWIPTGSGAPGLMTGSAGTAMDVLVTCFSKMGGGSGRRGCKYRARPGVRCISPIPFESGREILDFRVCFCEMSLKHSACHTFRASRVPCITLKSHLKSRKIESGVAF